ncbi:MAG: BREX system P-loop protein BrxC [Limnochordia bacterium]|jgi:hypothetical protein
MKNREIFQRDPVVSKLVNDGVATVVEVATAKEKETLCYELEHFVCEGQYQDGLIRILESYLGNASATEQPAVWVSGFFGSGKSHLLKMLRHLWVNTEFEDGATARELARLPVEIRDLLKELDVLGRRCGGLHAASGTLPSGGGKSLRLAVLGIIFRSKGLPESYPQAQFCLWLQRNGIYDQVKDYLADMSRDFEQEIRHLYVSLALADALLKANPDFASDRKQVLGAIRAQFTDVKDISTSEFIHDIRSVLSENGQLPCTAIVLDEVQLFIGDSTDRSYDVQEVTEALCKQLDSRILLIGAGQTALSGDIPLLQRLKDRFTIPVELSDADVETVTRRVVLAKKADKCKAIEDKLAAHAGEIDRQLVGTRIGPRSEDRRTIIEDYPILPVRRRFWESVLRSVDIPGTSSQLRTQLRIVHDAVRENAEKPLGTVVPADFIFDQLQPELLRTGALLREIDETIRNLDDGTPEGLLAKRICSLIYFVHKLPRKPASADIGIRATPDMLADLLVSDLANDGPALRREIPLILDRLVGDGKLMKVHDEYSLQTRESSEWENEFQHWQARFNSDLVALSGRRSDLLLSACDKVLGRIRLSHGQSKDQRRLLIHFGSEPPETRGNEIPVWVRDGWGENESTVVAEARAAGNDSPTVFVHISKKNAPELQKAIIEYEAAQAAINAKGSPTTKEGEEAHAAMSTRMKMAEAVRDSIITELVNGARVFQGGGQERFEQSLTDKVEAAAEASLARLFPKFRVADDSRWASVIRRARNGDASALEAIGWTGKPDKHPVCSAVLEMIGSGRTGKEVREFFSGTPYGWPRDSIDGALIVLFTTGHIRAVYKSVQLDRGELDQNKISVTDFRTETVIIDTAGRIRLRKLFQTAGFDCKPGEESSVAGRFLVKLIDLADSIGGAPPMPNSPSKQHLEAMRGLAGNEQLQEILKNFDVLSQQLNDWSHQADLAKRRKATWEQLKCLLQHARDLPETKELEKQASAVRDERRLLQDPDPVGDIHRAVAKVLRTAIRQAYSNFEMAYKREKSGLEANDNWQRLSLHQQQQILAAEGIAGLPELSIEDDESLSSSLRQTPLRTWKTRIDALPQQFANAAMAAARLLEPKTQEVRLPRQTLRTEEEVKAWLEEVEQILVDSIKKGPTVVP